MHQWLSNNLFKGVQNLPGTHLSNTLYNLVLGAVYYALGHFFVIYYFTVRCSSKGIIDKHKLDHIPIPMLV